MACPGAKNNVSTAGPRSGPGVAQTSLWLAWKMLRWERERDRSAGFSHSEVSGPCSEINREPLKLFASRKPVCVLLAGLSLAGIIWTAPRSPTTRPSAPPLLTHLLTSREMLQSELVSQALGSRRGPPPWQPLEMSQLRAANVENAHCLMHRCENWRSSEPEPS